MNDLPKEGNAFTWGKKLELIFGSEQREESIKIVLGVFLIFLVIVVLVPCIQAYMGGWLFSAAGL